jgi:hypothetical protein
MGVCEWEGLEMAREQWKGPYGGCHVVPASKRRFCHVISLICFDSKHP